MRGGRSLIILLVLAAGLGAYIYFVEAKRDPSAEETRARLFTVESDAIQEIEVRSAAGEITTLTRGTDGWQVTAPVKAPADESAVSSLLGAITTTDIAYALDDAPGDVTPFGLQPPKYGLSFKTTDGGTPHRLDVGDKTPTGSDMYARVDGQAKVLIVPESALEALNRTTFDLRDKAALHVPKSGADTLTLETPGAKSIVLTRKGEEWRLSAPVDAAADFTAADNILSRVEQAQMKAIVTEGSEPTPAQLKTYGLDTPQIVATIGSGSTRAIIAIGGKQGDLALYARDLSRPLVFTVEPSLLTDLRKTVDDLRAKDVFAMKSYSALSLEVTRAGVTTALAKSQAAATTPDASPADIWKQTRPSEKTVNTTAMTDLLNSLSSLRAERFVDRVPATGDDVTVAVTSGEAAAPKNERITLRRAGGAAYAIRTGEAGAAVVPTTDIDKVLEQLKALEGSQ